MGVGWTPLIPAKIYGRDIFLKLEYLSPFGSFKDRGVNAMVNQLVHMGVRTVVEDSSGNAGASLASHAARFGIKAEIYIPEKASASKRYQIAIYGADVKPIQGSRSAVEKAAQASITPGRAYASHAYNPAYLAGQVTAAYELWEMLGKKAPDWIICPTAQGGLFLGYWFGFNSLMNAGLINKMPRMIAAQPKLIAPIHNAFKNDLNHIPETQITGTTVAEGAAIAKPVRAKRILQALKETDGFTLALTEHEILSAQVNLAEKGYFVEPTSALAIAGFMKIKDKVKTAEIVVLPLTGNGLKGKPLIL
jgi:threonine synthase